VGLCVAHLRPQVLHVDTPERQAYLPLQLGVHAVKCLYRAIAVLGICLVCVSSFVIRADDPETTYDESEAPINLAAPVSVSPATNSPRTLQATRVGAGFRIRRVEDNSSAMDFVTPKRAPDSRLKLLCTLLC
jgi:hypothetical protein